MAASLAPIGSVGKTNPIDMKPWTVREDLISRIDALKTQISALERAGDDPIRMTSLRSEHANLQWKLLCFIDDSLGGYGVGC